MKIAELLEGHIPAQLQIYEVLSHLETRMKAHPMGKKADYQLEKDSLEVRYWGNWVVPEDEEDDGDYDWKKLDDKSSKELDELIKKFEHDRNCKIEVDGSEKCWLSFRVK